MGVLEKITKMRNEGRSDEEIVSDLKQQGTSPKEINEGLNQAQIKNAVSDISDGEANNSSYGESSQQNSYIPTPNPNSPRTQEVSDQEYGNQNYDYPQQSSQEEYYPQQGYENYDYNTQGGYGSPSSAMTSTDTMVEIAEQVFSEKIENMTKKVEDIEEFKTLAQTRLEHLMDRVRRIENLMDKLQAAILEKIGSYGNNLESIKKEMSMMQNSFSKTLNPLVDIAEGKHKTKNSSDSRAHKKTSKK